MPLFTYEINAISAVISGQLQTAQLASNPILLITWS